MEKEFNPLLAAAVFGAAFCTDYLAGIYTRRSAEGKALQASVASMGLLVISAITLYVFIYDWRYLPFEVAGAGAGTYVAIKLDSRKNERNKIRS